MGPLRGDGNTSLLSSGYRLTFVEKMGHLRGDGNVDNNFQTSNFVVEKMGPLRGDGNHVAE